MTSAMLETKPFDANATVAASDAAARVLETAAALAPEPREWAIHYESVYREAGGELSRVPWAHRGPCPFMVSWLNSEAPSLVRAGARVVVVGCGLGEDAAELCRRGYDVTAFDVSETAIHWAQKLHPDEAGRFIHADLFNLPGRLLKRFDLAVEIHTLQGLPVVMREDVAKAIESLLSHRGMALAIARGREGPGVAGADFVEIPGPPYALTRGELTQAFEHAGLTPVRPVDEFMDDGTPPVRRLRGVFGRG